MNINLQKIPWAIFQIQIRTQIDLSSCQGLMTKIELDLLDLRPIFKCQFCISTT